MIQPKIELERYKTETEKLLERKEPENAAVFYGSSTFTFWGHEGLKNAMSPIDSVNRGFGGSTAHEALYYYESLVRPLKPKILIWYEGDNDIAAGYSTDEIISLTQILFDKIRLDFPGIKFIVLTVKKSICREELWEKIDEYNIALKEYADGKTDMDFTDMNVFTFDEKGNAKKDIYIEDGLHFNEKGYGYLKKLIKPIVIKLMGD